MLMDTDGRPGDRQLRATSRAHARGGAENASIRSINGREDAHLVVMGDHLYQFFVARCARPRPLAGSRWASRSMTSVASQSARSGRHDQVSVLAGEGSHLNLVASTLPPGTRAALATRHDLARRTATLASRGRSASQDYLTYVAQLGDAARLRGHRAAGADGRRDGAVSLAAQCAAGHRRHRPGRRARGLAAAQPQRHPSDRRTGARGAPHPGRRLRQGRRCARRR